MDQQIPVYEIVVSNKVFWKEIKYKLMFYVNRLKYGKPDVNIELAFQKKISQLSTMTSGRGIVSIKRPVLWLVNFRILIDGYAVPTASDKQVQLQLPYGTYSISVEYDKVWDDGTSSPYESDKIQITLSESSPMIRLKALRPIFFKPRLRIL